MVRELIIRRFALFFKQDVYFHVISVISLTDNKLTF